MKKYLIIFSVMIALGSCSKDDLCANPYDIKVDTNKNIISWSGPTTVQIEVRPLVVPYAQILDVSNTNSLFISYGSEFRIKSCGDWSQWYKK
jgi:hypothetical protein